MKKSEKKIKKSPAASKKWGISPRMAWIHHRKKLAWAALTVLLLGLSVFVNSGLRIRSKRHMENEFLLALTEPSRLPSFVRRYHHQPLGAFAAHMYANQHSTEQRHEMAGNIYSKAASVLPIAHLDGLDSLLSAIEYANSHRTKEALEILQRIAHDEKQLSVVRAGAMYHMALIHHKNGKDGEKKDALGNLRHLPYAGIWEEKAAILATIDPADESDTWDF
ncbi:MAG: hypothetical protein LBG86_00920 [Puniceicoccales bacterium]|jgi:hypothetical protein|nr:hypothetical protein [Puniceicoccales bacterium]